MAETDLIRPHYVMHIVHGVRATKLKSQVAIQERISALGTTHPLQTKENCQQSAHESALNFVLWNWSFPQFVARKQLADYHFPSLAWQTLTDAQKMF